MRGWSRVPSQISLPQGCDAVLRYRHWAQQPVTSNTLHGAGAQLSFLGAVNSLVAWIGPRKPRFAGRNSVRTVHKTWDYIAARTSQTTVNTEEYVSRIRRRLSRVSHCLIMQHVTTSSRLRDLPATPMATAQFDVMIWCPIDIPVQMPRVHVCDLQRPGCSDLATSLSEHRILSCMQPALLPMANRHTVRTLAKMSSSHA